MDNKTNALNWFEIPANDINRAKTFYETIFGIEMDLMELGNITMASFPFEPGSGKAAGALVMSNMHKPSSEGAVIYLNANPDLQAVLDKIQEAGGKVEIPKTQITEDFGYMAFLTDTEGNKVALHSQG